MNIIYVFEMNETIMSRHRPSTPGFMAPYCDNCEYSKKMVRRCANTIDTKHNITTVDKPEHHCGQEIYPHYILHFKCVNSIRPGRYSSHSEWHRIKLQPLPPVFNFRHSRRPTIQLGRANQPMITVSM